MGKAFQNIIDRSRLPAGCGIYAITNKVTGEQYIGGSASVRNRCTQHANMLDQHSHYSLALQKAYDELGSDAFKFDLIDRCDLHEISIRETAWIEKYHPAYNTQKKSGLIRDPLDFRQRASRSPYLEFRTPSKAFRRHLKMAEMHGRGEDYESVARHFGVGVETARAACLRFPKRIYQLQAERVISLFDLGEAQDEISQRLSLSLTFIEEILKKFKRVIPEERRPRAKQPA